MITNRTRTAIIIALAAASFLLVIYFWVCPLFRLFVGLPRFLALWGWLLVLASAVCGLYLTPGWDISSNLLKVIVIIVLLVAILLGLAWLLLLALGYLVGQALA